MFRNILFVVIAVFLVSCAHTPEIGPRSTDHMGKAVEYPALPQIKFEKNFVLAGEPSVTFNVEDRTATLAFETVAPTPSVGVYYGVYFPNEKIQTPHYRRGEGINTEHPSTRHSTKLKIYELEHPQIDVAGLKKNGGGVVCYRLALFDPTKNRTIFYHRRFAYLNDQIVPTVVEGPFVDMVTRESAAISWETDTPTACKLTVNGTIYESAVDPDRPLHHEMKVDGLNPSTICSYTVDIPGGIGSKKFNFKTQGRPGERFKFAFLSDSRGGMGGGERMMNGANYKMIRRLLGSAYLHDGDFIVFGGDLVNGGTTSVADIRMQYATWKGAAEGVGHFIPIYEGMGNHESVVDIYSPYGYKKGKPVGIVFDKTGDD
ncbi:metallophosphoesterase, partial [Candidatus Hydrogenedentota bacterium]